MSTPDAASVSPVVLTPRLLLIRTVVIVTALLGVNYVAWRWLFSVRWSVWWIAVPLVLAETYSLIDSLLFGLTMWRLRARVEPPPPLAGVTVDVFITTYDEPLELVARTARAALQISYPHQTWILDDGNRAELHHWADDHGIGWIIRSPDWTGRPRHAKAGNLNNALLATDGEFLLILDADQVPAPNILDRTLGYFRDNGMALVQTPQVFTNVIHADPLGSQAPLFYGPIQQGKDGWNAAFFCGSNAVIRREALMRLGVSRYVREVEVGVCRALHTADAVLARARAELGPDPGRLGPALASLEGQITQARAELAHGQPLAAVTYRFQRAVEAISRQIVEDDAVRLSADLAVLEQLNAQSGREATGVAVLDEQVLRRFSQRDWSPLGAVESVRAMLRAIDVDRAEDAQPVMPLATISVTEDIATSMRLHAMGWKSAYDHETLAWGLAPEDLGSMLTQRLRWAQGTMQVMFAENPLVQKGLSVAQRLMYWATMWSYLAGFAAVVYLVAPALYLLFGVIPLQAYSFEYFVRLIPFLVVNQLLFFIVANGAKTWRGQQYSLAMFPIWIKAVTSAFASVYRHRDLPFAVTPKTRRYRGGPSWRLVKYQLIAGSVLLVAIAVGLARQLTGHGDAVATGVNIFWAVFELLILSVILPAARYRGYPTSAKEQA